MLAILWTFKKRRPGPINRGFRLAQTVSASAMALGHGLQDAQKTMGVIVLALVVGGYQDGFSIPWWVVVLAASAISLGTYSGGWRIMRTLGRRIIHLDPPRGFAAETVAASVLYTTAYVFEAPISTTQTITGSIMGVGATKRPQGGALGGRGQHPRRLGADHPDGRPGRRRRLLRRPPLPRVPAPPTHTFRVDHAAVVCRRITAGRHSSFSSVIMQLWSSSRAVRPGCRSRPCGRPVDKTAASVGADRKSMGTCATYATVFGPEPFTHRDGTRLWG